MSETETLRAIVLYVSGALWTELSWCLFIFLCGYGSLQSHVEVQPLFAEHLRKLPQSGSSAKICEITFTHLPDWLVSCTATTETP